VNHLISIFHCDDIYEVSVTGLHINRIVKFLNGTSLTAEMEYAECPAEVQDQIVRKLLETIPTKKSSKCQEK